MEQVHTGLHALNNKFQKKRLDRRQQTQNNHLINWALKKVAKGFRYWFAKG